MKIALESSGGFGWHLHRDVAALLWAPPVRPAQLENGIVAKDDGALIFRLDGATRFGRLSEKHLLWRQNLSNVGVLLLVLVSGSFATSARSEEIDRSVPVHALADFHRGCAFMYIGLYLHDVFEVRNASSQVVLARWQPGPKTTYRRVTICNSHLHNRKKSFIESK